MTDYPVKLDNTTSTSTHNDAKESKFTKYVIDHMNADHSDSLLVYARHYGKLVNARRAELIEINLTSMKLAVEVRNEGSSSSTTEHITVPFAKPLTDSSKYRVVLVEMAKEAAAALGIEVRSDDDNSSKHGNSNANYFQLANLPISAAIIAGLYLCYCAGTYSTMPAGTYWVKDIGLKIFRSQQNIAFVFYAAIVAHAFEAVLAFRECQVKGVTGVKQQLMWVAQTFLVGGPSLILLKRLKSTGGKKQQ